jgi:hypothetical protein
VGTGIGAAVGALLGLLGGGGKAKHGPGSASHAANLNAFEQRISGQSPEEIQAWIDRFEMTTHGCRSATDPGSCNTQLGAAQSILASKLAAEPVPAGTTEPATGTDVIEMAAGADGVFTTAAAGADNSLIWIAAAAAAYYVWGRG